MRRWKGTLVPTSRYNLMNIPRPDIAFLNIQNRGKFFWAFSCIPIKNLLKILCRYPGDLLDGKNDKGGRERFQLTHPYLQHHLLRHDPFLQPLFLACIKTGPICIPMYRNLTNLRPICIANSLQKTHPSFPLVLSLIIYGTLQQYPTP